MIRQTAFAIRPIGPPGVSAQLSQNRSAADRDGVIRALHAQGDALSQAVAAEMEGE